MRDKEEMLEYVKNDAEENEYYLCPEDDLLENLIEGLVENFERYGYPSCPCRAASGKKRYDVDIICPCEYRDADVNEHGMCYCGLFVSEDVKEDPSKLGPIPERRPQEIIDMALKEENQEEGTTAEGETEGKISTSDLSEVVSEEEITIWRCEVCGYLCAREMPPPVCPICKAKSERFEELNPD